MNRIPALLLRAGLRALVLCLVPGLAPAGTPVSAPVPADDPLYRELRLAENLGLTDGMSRGVRPVTRAGFFRLFAPLAEGIEAGTGMTPVPVDPARGITPSVSYRLSGARDAVVPWDVFWGRGEYPTTFDWQLLRHVAVEGSDIDSTLHGPHDLGFGYDRTEGLALVRDGLFFLEQEWFALQAGFRLRVDRDALTFRPLTLQARFGWRNLRLTAGREPLWWGPGTRGTMLLTTHARPFDQLRFETERPWRLPWFLRELGTWHVDAFVTRLDDPGRADYPDPWIVGTRLDWSPWPWLLVGANRTIMLGGEGNEFVLTWGSVWDLLFGNNENRSDGDLVTNNTDQRGGAEATVLLYPLFRHLPVVDGGRLYGEFVGEDSPQNGIIPSARAWIVGGEFVIDGHTVRVEHADIADDTALWYYHFIYTDGYTYRGRIVGHPAGTDVRTFAVELESPLGTWGFLDAGWELRRHGIHAEPGRTPKQSAQPVPTADRNLFRVGLEMDLGDYPGRLRLEGRTQAVSGDTWVLGPYEDWGVTLSWRN